MRSRIIIALSIIILLLIVAPIVGILVQDYLTNEDPLPNRSVNPPDLPNVLWQIDLENFATGLAAEDGRVYTIDIFGNIACYDSTTGGIVWEGSVGGYFSEGLVIYEDRLFGGSGGEVVGCLEKRTGRHLWDLRGIPRIKYGKPAPDNFTVVDGRLFVRDYSFSVVNASTGKLLWLVEEWGNLPGQSERLWSFNGWAFENNLLISSSYGSEGGHIRRLDPDDGTIIWSIDGMFVDYPIIYQEQVIVQNASETEILSLDVSSGDLLWSYDVGAKICQIIEHNGLLLFGASDNSFYAISLDNGTLLWKSSFEGQNITSRVNEDNPLEGLPVLVDQQNQTIIGIMAVTTQTMIDEFDVDDYHFGVLFSLDLKTGDVIWSEYFSGKGDISNERLVFDYAASEEYIFLSAINDLLIFSKKTGDLIEPQHFEHKITSPKADNGKVFVAADLWLFAYD